MIVYRIDQIFHLDNLVNRCNSLIDLPSSTVLVQRDSMAESDPISASSYFIFFLFLFLLKIARPLEFNASTSRIREYISSVWEAIVETMYPEY